MPSQFKTEAGFYVSGDPVYVSDLSDLNGIKHSIAQVLAHGCPIIPTPPVKQLEKWPVLRHAGVSSVAAFEKGTSCWVIRRDDVSFKFGPVKKMLPRGWEAEPEIVGIVSNNLSLDMVAEKISAELQRVFRPSEH